MSPAISGEADFPVYGISLYKGLRDKGFTFIRDSPCYGCAARVPAEGVSPQKIFRGLTLWGAAIDLGESTPHKTRILARGWARTTQISVERLAIAQADVYPDFQIRRYTKGQRYRLQHRSGPMPRPFPSSVLRGKVVNTRRSVANECVCWR